MDNADRYYSRVLSWHSENNIDFESIDHSRAEQNIINLYKWFIEDNRYYNNDIDVLILQVGVVDCAPRPIPRKVRNIISKFPDFLRKLIIKFLHNNRARLQNLGLKYYIVKPDVFYKNYYDFLTLASSLSKRVYVFNIVPTNDEIEKRSPGFKKSIISYNSIIAKVVKELGKENIFLMDVHSEFSADAGKIDNYVLKEDGHHITSLAHSIYAQKIIENEKNF